MANQTTGDRSSATQGGPQRGTASQDAGSTGVRDTTYNLISIAYHALQGAETYQIYEQDAQDDQELAQFFRQACEEQKRIALQAKQLLQRHLQRQGGGAGGQQLQSGASGQQASGSSGTSRSHQQSQAVPGDQYGSSQSAAAGSSSPRGGQQSQTSGQMGGTSTRGGSGGRSEGSD
jgi:hypothetical protein